MTEKWETLFVSKERCREVIIRYHLFVSVTVSRTIEEF